MARHSSFKVIIAQETYHNFFATVRTRALAQQWVEFGMGSDPLAGHAPGGPQLPGQTGGPDAAFFSAHGLPTPRSESWIESWLAGKADGPTL